MRRVAKEDEMKKKISMICMFVLLGPSLTILTSCTFKQTATEEGYVMLRNDTVYFITNKNFETKEELQSYMDRQINEKVPADMILKFDDKSAYKQLKSGYKVKVWSSEVFTSYPGQMIVKKFEIVERNDSFKEKR